MPEDSMHMKIRDFSSTIFQYFIKYKSTSIAIITPSNSNAQPNYPYFTVDHPMKSIEPASFALCACSHADSVLE
ncbi:hypothetical protein FPOAC1_012229 [Fusarium poae]|uniref:hypothetical protein n=1 Tax=Fusarium poae TaxID=36050 RepID=UPI001CE8B227|nr:hypothetical protein FPOAC1_012229 [Fusarium poae]KAG8667398.1 hypothetical protein FPOAC1_012229 [Fusarium poae]